MLSAAIGADTTDGFEKGAMWSDASVCSSAVLPHWSMRAGQPNE